MFFIPADSYKSPWRCLYYYPCLQMKDYSSAAFSMNMKSHTPSVKSHPYSSSPSLCMRPFTSSWFPFHPLYSFLWKFPVHCFISENIFGSFKFLPGRLTGKMHFLETIIDGISITQGHRLMLFITESVQSVFLLWNNEWSKRKVDDLIRESSHSKP